jgi:phosphoglycerol transferase
MELWNADLSIPFVYSGDGQCIGMYVKGIIDNGWFLHNKYVGMPTGLYMHDFPMTNSLDFVIIKLISYFTQNYGLTLNIFYLLTFPLVTLTSMLAFRQFKISYSSSIFGSLIYTFAPYHFLRGESHLFLSTYYIVPLVIMVILWLYEDNITVFDKNGKLNVLNFKFIASIIICILVGSSVIYYAFFSCYFLMLSGIILFLLRRNIWSLLIPVFFVGLITLSAIINGLPTILYNLNNGSNLEIITRIPQDAEVYGLKMIQLILPAVDRIPFFNGIVSKYALTTPMFNENHMASLGIIGSLGFTFLLVWVFYRTIKDYAKPHEIEQKFNALSLLNLSAFLLGTVGGFGSIFSYLVYSQIRGYNRISIFIAFFSIFAIVLLLDVARDRFKKDRHLKIFYYSFLIILLFGGIYDQRIPSIMPNYSLNEKEFFNDDNFVKEIDATMPENAMIFQLPYIPFPENPPQKKMVDYDHFRGYLHSNSLRWSYGAMKGREADCWQRSVSNKPLEEMIETLSLAGFNGIYVDSYGYTDSGSEITSNLSKILMTSPLKSENGRLYFFDMTLYNSQLKSHLTAEEEFKDGVINNCFFEEGFYSLENKENKYWRWGHNKAALYVTNPYDHDINMHIETSFFTGYDEHSNIKVESEYFSDNFSTNNSGYFYSKDFVLPPGTHRIFIKCDAKEVYAPNDSRSMVFRVENFKIGKYIL